jgi:hypothetical protein
MDDHEGQGAPVSGWEIRACIDWQIIDCNWVAHHA